jgi:histidinol-phosphatase (PHP family)
MRFAGEIEGAAMKTNFHTHTVFCDGKSTAEEVVQSAVQKGFSAIGFSGHGYAAYDLRCCIKDTEAYIREVQRLKEVYRDQLQVYLGVEEDALSPVDRSRFDYIIGSSHYIYHRGEYYSIDGSYEAFKQCLALFEGDPLRFAETYYSTFCDYIRRRKPDIIGHFDLVTKFDELDTPLFLQNPAYRDLAETYLVEAAKSGSIFEVNTGAIARGLRTAPYPSAELLHVLKKLDAPLILSSDSHHKDTLDFAFEEAKHYLREIGFRQIFTLQQNGFTAYDL